MPCRNTRTCIHTPISASFVSKDLSKEAVDRALSQADLVYFDGRFSDAALVVANKVSFVMNEKEDRGSIARVLFLFSDNYDGLLQAARLHIPIILDAENWKREALGDLMQFAEYVTCSGSFPLVCPDDICRPAFCPSDHPCQHNLCVPCLACRVGQILTTWQKRS